METIDVKPGDALQMEIQSFVHAVLQRTPPFVSGEEGREALALALEINELIQANLRKIPEIVSFYQNS